MFISSNSSSLFLESSFEEMYLKDEIERLNHEKEEIINEMNTFNQNYKVDKKKEKDLNKEIENEEENIFKSNIINYDDNFFMNFSPIKDQDFDIETDMNIFYDINSMNIEKEEKKNLFGENKEILIQDI
jgi:hypothetical protein